MNHEAVIGIEVHVELATESKMFCGCKVDANAQPNTLICPTCLGLPGALPVTNGKAIEWLAAIGLALNCRLTKNAVFHRKNYFYADLPKNYQISQYDLPVAVDGWLEVPVDEGGIRVGIERAHMEEDTGKSLHQGEGGRIHSAGSTLLDFNRSGVPLVEIVSRPDLHSAEHARLYAQELRGLVLALGVSDARMEEGSIRFDANVSIRPMGADSLGTKVEVKNMNSFRSLERAIAFEIERQIEVIEQGGRLVQETRHWDENAGVTHGMRTKEESSDYRYFVEPDLVPLNLDEAFEAKVAGSLPELPSARRLRYSELGVSGISLNSLVRAESDLQDLFESAVVAGAAPPVAALWVTGEVTGWLRKNDKKVAESALEGESLARLLAMLEEGLLSATAAKDVLVGVAAGEGGPDEVAKARDLIQVSDRGALEEVVNTILAGNADAVERFRQGEEKVVGFLVGQVMKATGGKADPKIVNELLRKAMA